MSNILILGFDCWVYKKSPLIRIYVNDIFLDEFSLSHYAPDESVFEKDYFSKKLMQKSELHPKYAFHANKIRMQMTGLYKFYEINDAGVKNQKVRIEFNNNDSNYTNGWLTKSTLIRLTDLYLVSKKVIDKLDFIGSYKWRTEAIPTQSKKIICEYNDKNRNVLFENFVYGFDAFYWHGGNKVFEFDLIRKLGFWTHKNKKNKLGIWKFGGANYHSLKKIINKYKYNENK